MEKRRTIFKFARSLRRPGGARARRLQGALRVFAPGAARALRAAPAVRERGAPGPLRRLARLVRLLLRGLPRLSSASTTTCAPPATAPAARRSFPAARERRARVGGGARRGQRNCIIDYALVTIVDLPPNRSDDRAGATTCPSRARGASAFDLLIVPKNCLPKPRS